MTSLLILISLVSLALSGASYAGDKSTSIETPVEPILTFEKLRSLIEQNQVSSIDRLLPYLPAGFMNRYALVTESRSLQGATPSHPRVIVYGLDGRFVLTFNGDPSHIGYDVVETMEFKKETATFELREIRFARGKPEYSEANPTLCLGCHGASPRPLWDPYPLWPGIYGSQDDALSERQNAPKKQVADYNAFWTARSSHDRYQHLQTPASIFASGLNRFDVSAIPEDLGSNNEELNHVFNRLNSKKSARMLGDAARGPLRRLRYAVLSSLTCAPVKSISAEDFLPKAIVEKVKMSYDSVLKTTKAIQLSSQVERVKREESLEGADEVVAPKVRGLLTATPEDTEATSRLRYYTENFGVSIAETSMSFPTGSYTYFDGVGGITQLESELWKELLSSTDDAEIYSLFSASYRAAEEKGYAFFLKFSDTDRSKLCQLLKDKSLQELSTEQGISEATTALQGGLLTSLESAIDRAKWKRTFSRCTSCHSHFGDPAYLSKNLMMPGFKKGTFFDEIAFRLRTPGKGKMPIGAPLTEPQIKEIETTLRLLISQ